MRDLSCYLSSISLHVFAVALVTATSVFETPDFAVTSGGVSIAGSQASAAIDTRIDFSETPVDFTETSPPVDPFQAAPPDTATAAAAERTPASPEIMAPSAPARPFDATRPRAIVEALLIPHEGLLERIDDDPVDPSTQSAQIEPAKTEPVKTVEEPESITPKPGRTPEPSVENPPQKKQPISKETVTPKRQDQPTLKTESAKPTPLKSSVTAPQRDSQKPGQAKAAAPSSTEPAGAKLEQLPRKLATNASPAYPLDAWQKQQEGVVYLLVRVSSSGLADSVMIYRSSGIRSLDAAAEKTVRSWKFQPALRAGKPIASPVVVPVRFRIQRQ